MNHALAYSIPLYVLLLIVWSGIPAVHAGPQYSIPTNGRYTTSIIGLQIQSTPKWAHDVVLDAAVVWNQAQVWYLQGSSSKGAVYTFVETNDGSATVNFNMPSAYSGIAVGWTDYKFAPASKIIIISTQTFLDPKVFTSSQENNATARQYAFWLALHELGRVLGLGSVLDSQDIMDPLWTVNRLTPMISMLNLYALCVLASGNAPNFVMLPIGMENKRFDARMFLTPAENPQYAPSSTKTLRRHRKTKCSSNTDSSICTIISALPVVASNYWAPASPCGIQGHFAQAR